MITIELPDDVALTLMTQISNQVGRLLQNKKAPQEVVYKVSRRGKSRNTRPLLLQFFEANKGKTFTLKQLEKATGLSSGAVSGMLSHMKSEGLAQNVGKGLWQAK